MSHPRDIVLIPMKRFDVAKSRLRTHLSADEVLRTIRTLAAGVIHAASPRECVVLCDDDDVEEFARREGASTLRVSDRGLNDAVSEGYALAGMSFDRAVIAHADLLDPQGLGRRTFSSEVTIVTDRFGRGTNVLVLPTKTSFRFFYGDDSARRHRDEANRLDLSLEFDDHSPWGVDIDGPDDLAFFAPT